MRQPPAGHRQRQADHGQQRQGQSAGALQLALQHGLIATAAGLPQHQQMHDDTQQQQHRRRAMNDSEGEVVVHLPSFRFA